MFTFVSAIIVCLGFSGIDFLTSLSVTSINLPEDDKNIVFDLSSYDKLNDTSRAFLNYFNVSNSNCDINIEVANVSSNGGFFVIQFHSFKSTFTLTNEQNETVSGKDTGLVQTDLRTGIVYRFQLTSFEQLEGDVMLLVAVVVYEKEDPIPGGCNLTFRPEISSYQNVTYTDSMVRVDAQPASLYTLPCENTSISLEMYHLHLREQTLNEKEYFESVLKMLTPDNIMSNGNKVPRPDEVLAGRRYYSAYIGTGSVYAVVAKFNDRTSAYIPTVSYACDTDNWDENCVLPTSTIWKLITAILLFIGTFSLIAGHAFFKVQTFIIGFVFGFFCGYVICNLTVGENVTASTCFGIIFGLIYSALWCCCGRPVVSISLSILFTGYITFCIFLYSSIGDLEYFRSSLNYWGICICGILFFILPFLVHPKFSHIFASSLLGATAITIAISHYTGANLQYIFLNSIRRMAVSGFNKAIIDPVFQYTDVLLSVLWLILLGSGIIVQLKTTKGRAPFPPQSQLENMNSVSSGIMGGIDRPRRARRAGRIRRFWRASRRFGEQRPLISSRNGPSYH